MTVSASLTSGGAAMLQYLNGVLGAREIGRRTPAKRSTRDGLQSIYDGYEKRVSDIGQGRSPKAIDVGLNEVPENFNPLNPLVDLSPYASGGFIKGTDKYGINMNPNADEAYFAHELGHAASTHTDVGALVRNLRSNPKLSVALTGALMTVPGVAAALEAGDDDMDTSLALAAAATLPTLIDEGLATKNGLAIMENAGRRASLGQRGKLAGGYLSYLAPAIMAGATGNLIGNQFDENTGEVPM